MKTLLTSIKWGNFLTILAQLIGLLTGLFPEQPWTSYLLAFQGALQAFMTSIGGLAHRASFGEAQAPAERTTFEVMDSANVTAAALVAAAPKGENISVPLVGSTIKGGKKEATP